MCMLHSWFKFLEIAALSEKKYLKEILLTQLPSVPRFSHGKIPRLPKQRLFFLKCVPLPAEAVIYVFVLSHSSPLTKRSQTVSQIFFPEILREGKVHRAKPQFALQSPAWRGGQEHASTAHTLFLGRKKKDTHERLWESSHQKFRA